MQHINGYRTSRIYHANRNTGMEENEKHENMDLGNRKSGRTGKKRGHRRTGRRKDKQRRECRGGLEGMVE